MTKEVQHRGQKARKASPLGRLWEAGSTKVGVPVWEAMKSAVVRHSVTIAGHVTSVSVEKEFWNALKEIARAKHISLNALVSLIDADRRPANLSSAIRLFALGF
jgi:predicted DNA-binding ribbon-helix-helix protein